MPTIFVSTKLSKLIGTSRLLPVDKSQKVDPLVDWNAHLFTLDRRKCIIMTNKTTLYSFVRVNVVKKDISNLSQFFIDSLFNQLKSDGLFNEQEEKFWVTNFENIVFAATDNDKKVIGSMNDMIYQLKVAVELRVAGLKNTTDTDAAKYVNDIPMSLIQYKSALDKMRDVKNNA